jgi:diacylglycerol kinase family enzyme
MQFLDPTHEGESLDFVAAPRLQSLQGANVAFISNGKEGTRNFFSTLERQLLEQHGVASVVALTKGNYSAPAEAEVMQQAANADVIITGVGD